MNRPPGPGARLALRVQALEACFRHIAATRMAGLPVLHPRLRVQAIGFAEAADDLALGVLLTPWFMNLVRLPLQPAAAAGLPAPGRSAELAVGGWRLLFHGQHEPAIGPFAAASLVSPLHALADQAAAVAMAEAVLEQLRPRPARRGFLFGRSAGAQQPC